VKTYNNVPFYQNLLLQKNSNVQTIYLASNLNYLVTKKRLIMMTKHTSKKVAVLKKIAIIPVFAGLISFLCFKVIAQEKTSEQKPKPVLISNSQNVSDKDKNRDAYYKGVWVKISDKKSNKKISSLYENLSLEEKRKYLDFVPEKMMEKEIPEPLFEKMKTKNMSVWINDKLSNKEEISKYKRTDFAYYFESYVYKNARSKRFPHEYQYTIYTKDYFDRNLKNSHIHFSGDTIKIGIAPYKNLKKTTSNKINSDSVFLSPTEKKDVYNMHIK
jgi:hypothetical protein